MQDLYHQLKDDPKLWELWSIPYYGYCRVYIINCMSLNLNPFTKPSRVVRVRERPLVQGYTVALEWDVEQGNAGASIEVEQCFPVYVRLYK